MLTCTCVYLRHTRTCVCGHVCTCTLIGAECSKTLEYWSKTKKFRNHEVKKNIISCFNLCRRFSRIYFHCVHRLPSRKQNVESGSVSTSVVVSVSMCVCADMYSCVCVILKNTHTRVQTALEEAASQIILAALIVGSMTEKSLDLLKDMVCTFIYIYEEHRVHVYIYIHKTRIRSCIYIYVCIYLWIHMYQIDFQI